MKSFSRLLLTSVSPLFAAARPDIQSFNSDLAVNQVPMHLHAVADLPDNDLPAWLTDNKHTHCPVIDNAYLHSLIVDETGGHNEDEVVATIQTIRQQAPSIRAWLDYVVTALPDFKIAIATHETIQAKTPQQNPNAAYSLSQKIIYIPPNIALTLRQPINKYLTFIHELRHAFWNTYWTNQGNSYAIENFDPQKSGEKNKVKALLAKGHRRLDEITSNLQKLIVGKLPESEYAKLLQLEKNLEREYTDVYTFKFNLEVDSNSPEAQLVVGMNLPVNYEHSPIKNIPARLIGISTNRRKTLLQLELTQPLLANIIYLQAIRKAAMQQYTRNSASLYEFDAFLFSSTPPTLIAHLYAEYYSYTQQIESTMVNIREQKLIHTKATHAQGSPLINENAIIGILEDCMAGKISCAPVLKQMHDAISRGQQLGLAHRTLAYYHLVKENHQLAVKHFDLGLQNNAFFLPNHLFGFAFYFYKVGNFDRAVEANAMVFDAIKPYTPNHPNYQIILQIKQAANELSAYLERVGMHSRRP